MAITTTYKGIEYRSRLEARWAAFFDEIDWRHTYEPFDGNGYIPDFLIHGDSPLIIEVKPALLDAEYRAPLEKVSNGLRGKWTHDILVVGVTPWPTLPGSWAGQASAGILGEYFPADTAADVSGYLIREDLWEFATGWWLTCEHCGSVGVFHDHQSYASRPCGHHDGDHYLGALSTARLERAWATATNNVKWRGQAA